MARAAQALPLSILLGQLGSDFLAGDQRWKHFGLDRRALNGDASNVLEWWYVVEVPSSIGYFLGSKRSEHARMLDTDLDNPIS